MGRCGCGCAAAQHAECFSYGRPEPAQAAARVQQPAAAAAPPVRLRCGRMRAPPATVWSRLPARAQARVLLCPRWPARHASCSLAALLLPLLAAACRPTCPPPVHTRPPWLCSPHILLCMLALMLVPPDLPVHDRPPTARHPTCPPACLPTSALERWNSAERRHTADSRRGCRRLPEAVNVRACQPVPALLQRSAARSACTSFH